MASKDIVWEAFHETISLLEEENKKWSNLNVKLTQEVANIGKMYETISKVAVSQAERILELEKELDAN